MTEVNDRSNKNSCESYVPNGNNEEFQSNAPLTQERDGTSSPICSTITFSVVDNSSSRVNSRAVLYTKRFRDTAGKYIKKAFSPVLSRNNIKIFGSKKFVKLERERSKASCYIIHPLSHFRQCWDFVIMIVMLLNIIILPLDIAFSSSPHNAFLILSDVFCILDIVLNFRTGYHANPEDKAYELSGKKIALYYLKTWFVIDIVSALPLNHIILIIFDKQQDVHLGVKGASHALKIMKVLKLLRLIKLLRISRIIRCISTYEKIYRVTTTVIRYIKLIAMMMIVAHWNGCLHFLVPLLQDFPKGCWVTLSKLEGKPWYIQYGWALFKTLSHMLAIGYGRFTPELLTEALLTTFTMVTGATFYALFISHSLAYMIECNYSKISYMEKMKETSEYLSYRNIPEDLKQRVLTYFNQKYTRHRYFNEDEVLSQVSKPIRDEIIRYTCRDVINSMPYLKDIHPDILSTILDMLSSNVYLPGDIIMQEGDIGSDIYFVRHGEVELTVQGKVIETLNDGDYFGECNVLVEQKRLYSAKAIIPCDVLILMGSEFKKVLNEDELMRPLLEHGAICRLIRIYNRCRLFTINDVFFSIHEEHTLPVSDSTRSLYNLFKIYLGDLFDIEVNNISINDKKSLRPSNTQSDLEKLLGIAVQSHRMSHTLCDITPSLIKDSSDANVDDFHPYECTRTHRICTTVSI